MIPIHLFLIFPCFFLFLACAFFNITEMPLFVQLQIPIPLPSSLPLTLPLSPPHIFISSLLPPFLLSPPSHFILLFDLPRIIPWHLLPNNKLIPYVRTSVIDVFCYNSWTEMLCNGNEGRNCSCLAKVT